MNLREPYLYLCCRNVPIPTNIGSDWAETMRRLFYFLYYLTAVVFK
jgi:hypothetical protein